MADTQGDPLWQHDEIGHVAGFAPLDIGVAVGATHEVLLSLASRTFGDLGAPTPRRPALVLTLAGTPNRGHDAPGLAQVGNPRGAAQTWSSHRERGGLFVAGVAGAGLVAADLSGARASAFIELSAVHDTALCEQAREVLIGAPVWRFAAHAGLVALHGAAVSTPEGTVVLRGPSGSGKSTAACALGLHGWPVLADEVVWIDPLGAHPVLRGAQPFVRAEPDALVLMPPLAELTGAGGGQGTIPLGAGGLPRTAVVPLGPIAFLRARSANGHGSFRRIGGQDALARFEESSIPGEHTQRPDAFATARNLLLAHGAFDVNVGGLDALPDLLVAIAAAARA